MVIAEVERSASNPNFASATLTASSALRTSEAAADSEPSKFSDSPDARSKTITAVDSDTQGVLNRLATKNAAYQVGISEDKGARRTMEDAHSFVFDFDGIRGQGFFAIFDGHAGKHAAEWCGRYFHQTLLEVLHASPPTQGIPDILNTTFHTVDNSLSQLSEESQGRIHSGCTVVTAFLRLEDQDGQQSFLGSSSSLPPDSPTAQTTHLDEPISPASSSEGTNNIDGVQKREKKEKSSSRNRIKQALKSFSSSSSSKTGHFPSPPASAKTSSENVRLLVPPPGCRRVLYTANAGDARGVLCRSGKSVRLTYDHKGSDKQEAKRITDAGGFVMSGRVNGVLAVTRSLGDSSMKEFVVGSPYTTETELCEEDEFLILACDGLWDVISDQTAVTLVRDIEDSQAASQKLLKYALSHHTTDNVTVLVVRFKHAVSAANAA